ncbi:hypothetical protein ACGCUP_00060 [Eubacteriales bacterium KG125]
MIKKAKKIIKGLNKKKGKSDYMLKIFIVIFILGYGFFFTSNYFFPKIYRNIDVINVGKIIDLEEYIFTLNAWDYSRDDNEFEIIFNVQNLTLEENPKFHFTVKAGDKVFMNKIHKNYDNKLLVVRVYDIPKRWTEVKISITAGDKTLQTGMNDKIVNKVKKIKNRNEKEYKVYASKSTITGLKNNIKVKEKELKSLEKKTRKAYKKLEELDGGKTSLTKKEQEVLANNKSKIAAEVGKMKAEMDSRIVEIEENKERIKMLNEEIKNL